MNPKINNVSEEDGIMRFTLSGVNLSLANAIRRIMLNNIDTVVFRTETSEVNQCKIEVNTGRLHNEIVKQRLSCIPIHSTDITELPGKYYLEVDVLNNTDHIIYVTTEHFAIKDKQTHEPMPRNKVAEIFPPDSLTGGYIDFVRLRPQIGATPGEQIKLTCEFAVANAEISSMFNVVSKCAYAFTPDATKAAAAWEKIANKKASEGATQGEIEYAKKDFYAVDAQRYYVEDSFDFVVASVGVFSNMDIVKKACKVMEHKLLDTIAKVDRNTLIIEHSETTMDNCFDIVLVHEDYTMGKAIEYYMYDRYFAKEKRLSFCAFRKHHPHDDYSVIQVAYKDGVSMSNIMEDVKVACQDLVGVYVAIHRMM